jgi:hypothetical protein
LQPSRLANCGREVNLNHGGHGGHGELIGDAALTGVVIDAGLKVHRALGPGLLESAYEHCLAHELAARNVSVQRQVALLFKQGLRRLVR